MSLWRCACAAAAFLALCRTRVVVSLEDSADRLRDGPVRFYSNVEVASNDGVNLDTFNGDEGRYIRAKRGEPSFLNYTDADKIQGVEIAFFANVQSLSAGTWQITLSTGLPDQSWIDVGSIFSLKTIGEALPGSSGPTVCISLTILEQLMLRARRCTTLPDRTVLLRSARLRKPVDWAGRNICTVTELDI